MTGWCIHCRTPISIPSGYASALVACPQCAREVPVQAALAYRRGYRRSRRAAWVILGLGLLVGLAAAGYLYRGRLTSAFDLLVEVTGSTANAAWSLGGALVVLLWLALWLLFPFLAYMQLRRLERRAAELDESTRICLRHLARLTSSDDKPGHARSGQGSATTAVSPPPDAGAGLSRSAGAERKPAPGEGPALPA